MDSLDEHTAVEEVLAGASQPVLHYLMRYVGDRAVAEDLQQETLVRIARGWSSFAGRSSVKTWAFSIASRVAADYFRHPDRQARIVELDEASNVPDTDPTVGERLVQDEMSRCVREVIDSLPDTYRAALILHDLEGLSAEQTAQACECSVATAKIRIHRARQRLREALDQACSFYHDREGVYRCDRKAQEAG